MKQRTSDRSASVTHRLFRRERLTSPSSVLVGTNAASNLLRLVSTILLTRLLAPDAFGLIAIIGSFFYVITMVTDAGFQAYIVRHERDDPHFVDAIWTIHFSRGVLNACAAALLATPIAWLLRKPELAPLAAAAAVTFAIDGLASLTLLTALRRNMVRRLSLVDLGAQVTQFIVGVAAAWLLRNAWALVVSLVASSCFRTLASYMFFPDSRRRFRMDRPLAVELWRFSRVIAASSMLTLAIAQIDKLVLGRAMSLDQFGIYAIAVNLAAAPTMIANQYVSRIFYPNMAETWRRQPDAMQSQSYKLRGILFYGYLFCGGALIGGAPLLIRLLYDARYLHAGFYLQLLAISSTLVILTSSALHTLVAVGEVRYSLLSNVVRLTWLLPVGLGGLLIFGPIGLIVALALVELPPYLYLSWQLIARHLFNFRSELVSWAAAFAGILLGLAAVQLANLILGVA